MFGKKINIVNINDSTVIKEFGRNYYLRKTHECNHYSENERYAVLVKYCDFMSNPDYYIELAFQKRNKEISNYVRVRSFD